MLNSIVKEQFFPALCGIPKIGDASEDASPLRRILLKSIPPPGQLCEELTLQSNYEVYPSNSFLSSPSHKFISACRSDSAKREKNPLTLATCHLPLFLEPFACHPFPPVRASPERSPAPSGAGRSEWGGVCALSLSFRSRRAGEESRSALRACPERDSSE